MKTYIVELQGSSTYRKCLLIKMKTDHMWAQLLMRSNDMNHPFVRSTFADHLHKKSTKSAIIYSFNYAHINRWTQYFRKYWFNHDESVNNFRFCLWSKEWFLNGDLKHRKLRLRSLTHIVGWPQLCDPFWFLSIKDPATIYLLQTEGMQACNTIILVQGLAHNSDLMY